MININDRQKQCNAFTLQERTPYLKKIKNTQYCFKIPKGTLKENNITKQIIKTQRPHLVKRTNTQRIAKMNNYSKQHKSIQHFQQLKQQQQNDKSSL